MFPHLKKSTSTPEINMKLATNLYPPILPGESSNFVTQLKEDKRSISGVSGKTDKAASDQIKEEMRSKIFNFRASVPGMVKGIKLLHPLVQS